MKAIYVSMVVILLVSGLIADDKSDADLPAPLEADPASIQRAEAAAESTDQPTLDLLVNYHWIKRRLETLGMYKLLRDYDQGTILGEAGMIHDTLKLAAPVLDHDKGQLYGQLHGRLAPSRFKTTIIPKILVNVPKQPHLRLKTNTIAQPGGPLIRSLPIGTLKKVVVRPTSAGNYDLLGIRDDTILVFESHSGRMIDRLAGHTGTIQDIALMPGGKYLVTGCDAGELKIWNLVTRRAIRELKAHEGGVQCVAVSDDGRTIVSGGWDNRVVVWDVKSASKRHVLEGHSQVVLDVAINATSVISASRDRSIRVWHLESGESRGRLTGHRSDVTCIALSNASGLLASGSNDLTIRLWDIESNKSIAVMRDHSGRINDLAFSTNGKRLVSVSSDSRVYVWDAISGRLTGRYVGHFDRVNSIERIGKSDEFVTCSNDGTLKQWRTRDVSVQSTPPHDGPVWDITMDEDGKHVLSVGVNRKQRKWDPATGRVVATQTLEDWAGSIRTVANGRFSISRSLSSNTRKIWNLRNGRVHYTMEGDATIPQALDVMPDGRWVLVANDAWEIGVWDVDLRKPIRWLRGHRNKVSAVCVSKDGTFAVSGGLDQMLKVWKLPAGNLVGSIEGHGGRINQVQITPDQKMAISVSDDFTVRVWDIASRDLIGDFWFDAPATRCLLCPDGQTIAVGDQLGRIHFVKMVGYDRESGRDVDIP